MPAPRQRPMLFARRGLPRLVPGMLMLWVERARGHRIAMRRPGRTRACKYHSICVVGPLLSVCRAVGTAGWCRNACSGRRRRTCAAKSVGSRWGPESPSAAGWTASGMQRICAGLLRRMAYACSHVLETAISLTILLRVTGRVRRDPALPAQRAVPCTACCTPRELCPCVVWLIRRTPVQPHSLL